MTKLVEQKTVIPALGYVSLALLVFGVVGVALAPDMNITSTGGIIAGKGYAYNYLAIIAGCLLNAAAMHLSRSDIWKIRLQIGIAVAFGGTYILSIISA